MLISACLPWKRRNGACLLKVVDRQARLKRTARTTALDLAKFPGPLVIIKAVDQFFSSRVVFRTTVLGNPEPGRTVVVNTDRRNGEVPDMSWKMTLCAAAVERAHEAGEKREPVAAHQAD
jgi:hypothetical protein